MTADAVPARNRRRRRWPARLVVVALLMSGVAVTSWPVGVTVVENYDRTQAAIAVEQDTADVVPAKLRQALARARRYNATLKPETLQDPWTRRGKIGSADQARYLDQLALFPAMGTVTIPKIRVRLPISHNATAKTMAHGAGHFFGTSLPVGGRGTHAVLAGHSGMGYATLFDRLPELQAGDRFWIRIYGEILTYRVDRIVKVLPNQLDEVTPVPGKDYVTLLTCTPRLVNTYRLLVRGVRVPDESSAATLTGDSTTQSVDLTVQRWMIPRLAVSLAVLGILGMIVVGWIVGDRRRGQR